mmetsp:Transcript_36470/g.56039  ORF Transcript_36470/g.56039 Transcript_36470/m.56039 type:complete len:319 (+) Transcript_36470:131-1087(+)
MRGLTATLSNSSLNEPGRGNRASPRKMKIMKRSTSDQGNRGQSRKGNAKGGNKNRDGRNGLRGKNLIEKEKVYAEARARIFNDGKEENGDSGNDHAIEKELSEEEPTWVSTIDDKKEEARIVVKQQRKFASGNDSSPPPSSDHVQGIVQDSTVPAAVSAGGVSKVTWRNRRQEVNDPDFRRQTNVRPAMQTGGHFIMASQQIPVAPTQHQAVAEYNAIMAHPQVYQQQGNLHGVSQHGEEMIYRYPSARDLGDSMNNESMNSKWHSSTGDIQYDAGNQLPPTRKDQRSMDAASGSYNPSAANASMTNGADLHSRFSSR